MLILTLAAALAQDAFIGKVESVTTDADGAVRFTTFVDGAGVKHEVDVDVPAQRRRNRHFVVADGRKAVAVVALAEKDTRREGWVTAPADAPREKLRCGILLVTDTVRAVVVGGEVSADGVWSVDVPRAAESGDELVPIVWLDADADGALGPDEWSFAPAAGPVRAAPRAKPDEPPDLGEPTVKGGGPFKSRFAGKKDAVNRGGGSDATEEAVLAALKWLSRHQNPDGSWSMKAYADHCEQSGRCLPHGVHQAVARFNYDAGITAPALMAFLGSGYTHASKETHDGVRFGDVVGRALGYLLREQDQDGCVGSRDLDQYMYGHAIAARALAEAYGMTGSPRLKEPAQKAIDFLVAARNPGRGWRYIYQAGENDTSVTGWAVQAIDAARRAGLDVDLETVYGDARAWLDRVSYRDGKRRWKCGYQFAADADVAIPGVNDHYDQHPTMTAIGVSSRLLMGTPPRNEKVADGVAVLLEDLPAWKAERAVDFYYWHHATPAVFAQDGPDGASWKAWNRAMTEALLEHQIVEGCAAGSWEAVDRWSCKAGRVYATAINALTLETYYR